MSEKQYKFVAHGSLMRVQCEHPGESGLRRLEVPEPTTAVTEAYIRCDLVVLGSGWVTHYPLDVLTSLRVVQDRTWGILVPSSGISCEEPIKYSALWLEPGTLVLPVDNS